MPAAAPPPRATGVRRPETRERRGAHRTRLRAQPAARADPRSPVRVNSHPSAATPRGFAEAFMLEANRHNFIIIKPRRTSRANKTAPCQHFTSTNSNTRVFCLLTGKPHQSKKTSMKNRSRTRHVMVQSIGDTSGMCVKVNILACPPRSRSHAATDDDSRPADRAGFCLNRCAHSPSVRRT